MMQVAVQLAVKELRHEWRAGLCLVASIVSILAPLLVLLALKNGVIDALVEGLVDDPRNREILSTRASSLDAEFFAKWSRDPQIDFISPRTRAVNTQVKAVQNSANRKVVEPVTLLPSGPGDPLLPSGSTQHEGAYITERLARQIEWQAGDEIVLIAERTINGTLETARTRLPVHGIVPERSLRQHAVFVPLDVLVGVERFVDDQSLAPELWMTDVEMPQAFASFRLYVRELADLEEVNERLRATGLSTRPLAQNAVSLLDFRTRLNGLYAAIAGLAVLGFWAAMAANLRGMVERQRTTFSFLNLIGYQPIVRASMPLIQSVTLVLLGIVASLAIVLPMLAVVNLLFQDEADNVAVLGLWDIVLTIAVGLCLALISSIWAIRAAVAVSADEVLRNA